MMPINFHHNKGWFEEPKDTYSQVIPICREKKIGILGIKPLGGDPWRPTPSTLVSSHPHTGGPATPKAALRFLWQNPDLSSSLPSINTVGELYDDLDAIWRPEFTKEDREVLNNSPGRPTAPWAAYLPPKYKWMENWRIREV